MAQNEKRQPLIQLVSCMAMMLLIGVVYLWSIFKDPVAAYFSWSQTGSTAVFSIMFPVNVLGIMTGGFIGDKKGMAFAVRLGSVLVVAGMGLTALIPQNLPALMYVTYACMVGYGSGLINNACLSCVQKWWYMKRGLAVGLVNACFAMTTVVFAPVINWLLKTSLGVPGVFALLGGLFLAVFLLAGRRICPPPEGWIRTGGAKQVSLQGTRQFAPGDVVRSPMYYLLIIVIMCMTGGYLMVNPMMKSLALEKGLAEGLAVTCVMLSGVASTCGRFVMAWLSDRLSCLTLLLACYGALLLSTLGLSVLGGGSIILCLALISFVYGGSSSLTSILSVTTFGNKYLSSNYGLMMMAVLISGTVYPAIATAMSPLGYPGAGVHVLALALPLVGAPACLAWNRLHKKEK